MFKWIDAHRCPVRPGPGPSTPPPSARPSSDTLPPCPARGREKLASLPWCLDVFTNVSLQHISQLPLPPRGDDVTKTAPIRGLPVMSSEWVLQVCQLPLLRYEAPSTGKEEQGEGGVCPGEVDLLSFDNIDDPLRQLLAATPVTPATPCPSPSPGTTREDSLSHDMNTTGSIESASVYETAEDVLESLLCMQADMREFWAEIVEAFSPDEKENDTCSEPCPHAAQHGGTNSQGGTSGEVVDNGSDEDCSPVDGSHLSTAYSPSPQDFDGLESPSGDGSSVADDIIKSWGLLDVVSGSEADAPLALPVLPKGFAVPSSPPDLMSLSLSQSSMGHGVMK